jgi:hypothetical protein
MKATRECSTDGCERTGQTRRGLCELHYDRLRRTPGFKPLPIPTLSESLAAGLERKPNGCLEWTGLTNEAGYGRLRSNGQKFKAHRLAWTLVNGIIPDGLNVLHHCDNPPCCETEPSEAYPEGHLFLGTQTDNMADMMAKGRHHGTNGSEKKTHCKRGHKFTQESTYVYSDGRRICRECRHVTPRPRP